jgi:tetratricopeptide (TPR) repeat protein
MRCLFATLALAVLATSTAVLAQQAPPDNLNRVPDDLNRVRAREHYSVGWEHMRSEAFDRAAAEFQLATDFEPRFAMAWYGLGRAHMALRKYQQALLNLEESRALFTAEVSQRFNNRMDADRARRDRVLELQHIRGQYLKGPQNDQSRDMVRLIDNRIRVTSQDIEREFNADFETAVPAFVSLSLGSAYFRKERFAEAERAYKEALRADDTTGVAHNNLAALYQTQGRYAEAQSHIRAAEKAGFFVNPDLKSQVASRSLGQ